MGGHWEAWFGCFAVADDDETDSSLREAVVGGVEKGDFATVSPRPKTFADDLESFARFAAGSASGKHTADVFKDNHFAATFVSEANKVFEELASWVIEPFLLSGAAPGLARRTSGHERDLPFLAVDFFEDFFAGEIANVSTFKDGVGSEAFSLVGLEGFNGVFVAINGVEAVPARFFKAEVKAAAAREET